MKRDLLMIGGVLVAMQALAVPGQTEVEIACDDRPPPPPPMPEPKVKKPKAVKAQPIIETRARPKEKSASLQRMLARKGRA